MTEWYPVMLKVEGRKCVVFGGGAVAERKIDGLLQAKADVYIVSPQATPTLQSWAEAGRLQFTQREAVQEDLEGAVLVFAATDRLEINNWIAELARKSGIPVNIADAGEQGDFLTPAVVRRGGLVLTASASGAGPAMAARIIRELSEQYGPEYQEHIETIRTIRAVVKDEVLDLAERRDLLQAAVTAEALEEWRSAAWLQDKEKLLARLRQRVNDRKGK
ncbi:bifunctional precorrin-2 dehydrogenase/sirohydrochlorin ferrochelatase [Cohnella sp.]|uniref:precorrin-2 dehydrogenase/sirohydrochlorin ferrochelatase family protein n=1 Tax=Cohnella sp. TaxID=1883426 RepID=UPI003565752B